MKYPKRTQYKYTKRPYGVRNWAEYDAALQRRGDLTLWIADDTIEAWQAPKRSTPGGQRIYTDLAIETGLTVRMIYKLPLRQTEGFLRSIFRLLDLELRVPDHSTLSRRGKKLGKIPLAPRASSRPIHIMIDSTGLRIHVGHRKAPKRRDFRKLHLTVDLHSGEIIAADLTSRRAIDASRVAPMLAQIEAPVTAAYADGAYDQAAVYEALERRGKKRKLRILIPPKKGAKVSSKASLSERNRNIRSRARYGRRERSKKSGYSKRAMVENTIYRYKSIIGGAMKSRTIAGQRAEARIGCKILNTMTRFGMPESYRIN